MEKYERLKVVGEGSFGVVNAALDKQSHEIVAIKVLKHERFSSLHECLYEPEVHCLRKLRKHPNIVELKDVIFDSSSGCGFFVFELMEGNLLELIDKRQQQITNNRFSESEIRISCHQILQALDHTHKNGIFHRDMKPENLLVKQGVVKIGDYGSAMEIGSGPFTDYVTTRWYRAPEVLCGSPVYDSKVDMWAMGAIMAELFNLCPLFPGSDAEHQIELILDRGPLSSMIPSASESAINLIESLLSWEPHKRPTAAQALQHPFFVGSYRIPRPIHPPHSHRHSSSHILPASTITSVDY